jgi:hypothetical protein
LGIGDINDDDRTDILIGAPNADYNGRNDSGSAYAVFGTASPGPVDLAALGTSGIRVDGQAADDLSGSSVAALDVNGDSVDDLVSGAPSADNNGRAQSGSVYVVYGGVQVGNRDLAAPDRRFDGAAADDRTGRSVAAIGDLDGDAGEDVAIGAPFAGNNGRFGAGSAYVVFGEPFEVEPAPITTPQPSATLKVKARKATKKVRRTGRAVLVRKVTVGPGQKYRTTVRVKPKRTRARSVVRTKKGKVLVRTMRAGRGRITVRITATGPGVTPKTWSRTWRVR